MKALLLAGLLALTATSNAADLPGDSVYQLDLGLTTQEGKAARLDLDRGAPTIVSMFYGSCPHICPMLISTIQRIERQLDEPARKQLRVLMVSIDPARDTPAALKKLAGQHQADLSRWTFAQMPGDSVRELAAVLGIQYRQLPDGEFNHSTIITLLDREGRIVRQTSLLGRLDEEFVAAVKSATAAPPR